MTVHKVKRKKTKKTKNEQANKEKKVKIGNEKEIAFVQNSLFNLINTSFLVLG